MGNQILGKSLENNTIRVLDEILSRYENNIDYVIFAGDIDYHFQRASGTIPEYTEFFNNVSSKIKENHPYVKIGNTLSLENVINKDLVKGGQFELIPQFEMGDFVAFSYKPTDIVGDIARTPDYTPSGKESIWPAIDDFKKTLEMFPDTKIAFFEITWSTSNFVNGSKEDQKKFIDSSFEFYKENQSEIEFFTWARLFDKPKGTFIVGAPATRVVGAEVTTLNSCGGATFPPGDMDEARIGSPGAQSIWPIFGVWERAVPAIIGPQGQTFGGVNEPGLPILAGTQNPSASNINAILLVRTSDPDP